MRIPFSIKKFINDMTADWNISHFMAVKDRVAVPFAAGALDKFPGIGIDQVLMKDGKIKLRIHLALVQGFYEVIKANTPYNAIISGNYFIFWSLGEIKDLIGEHGCLLTTMTADFHFFNDLAVDGGSPPQIAKSH